MKKTKAVSIMLTGILAMGTLLAACSKEEGGQAVESSPTAKTNQPRTKLKLFMADSGLPHPSGVDPSNNSFINIIEDYANVDLSLEVPSAQDFKTKVDLLLASGNLPDILHTTYAVDAEARAREGAFIDLKKYYDKSPMVQKYITPEMMEFARDPLAPAGTGYWRIPMSNAKFMNGSGVVARYDLIEKYNGGKYPETVDEWIDLLRKIKKAQPDTPVFSNRVINDKLLNYGGLPIYYWYGALPYEYRVQSGKVVSNFTLPEFKAATEKMKMLYSEGIFDIEFAVVDAKKWIEKYVYNDVLFSVDSPSAVIQEYIFESQFYKETPSLKSRVLDMAPSLTKYPAELKDVKYTWGKMLNPIRGGHSLLISSKTKDPDLAWKVIEGFAAQNLHEAIYWGKEGETFSTQNGKRVPIVDKINDPSRAWALHLGVIMGFEEGIEIKKTIVEQNIGKVYGQVSTNLDKVAGEAKKGGYPLTAFYVPSDAAKNKAVESREFISKTTAEAIMGKITMQQFDERVKEFVSKYGFMYDEMTKYINDNKDALRKKGVVEVDW
ncbi:extracellular solute-binding protein [Paenibacillus koleovorans]|uniref:extracellular solute-binding protein n=1 Tax=Paenibacillus koleovorans TaxID=121608 RepID=UPI000FDAB37C|nr:extracellular solute-binding protein [Paenibacillus koleovorans]